MSSGSISGVAAGRCNGHNLCWSVSPLGLHAYTLWKASGMVSAGQDYLG